MRLDGVPACAGMRAPVGQPRVGAAASEPDRRAAAPARLADAAVHPQPLVGIQAAGRPPAGRWARASGRGRRRWTAAVAGRCRRSGQVIVRQRGDGACGWTPATNRISDLKTLPMPATHALIEQHVGDRLVGRAAHPAHAPRRRRTPGRAGPDRAAAAARGGPSSRRSRNSATGTLKPTATKRVGRRRAMRMSRARALPALAGPVDVPAAVHAHVRAQDEVAARTPSAGACRAR